MQKTLLSLLLLSGLDSAAQSQRSTLGLRAGLNLARYSGGYHTSNTPLTAGLAGLTVTSALSQAATTALEVELLYSGKGHKFDYAGAKDVQRLHYVELPVLLQFRPAHFELELGPQFGFLVAQRNEQVQRNGNRSGSSGTEGFNVFQAGVIAGVGYRTAAGVGFGIRYNQALNSISGDTDRRNATVQVQASFQFHPLQPKIVTAQ